MSEEQLKAFWEAIQADTVLQQKLEGVTDPDAIVAVAKEAGFSISADELKNAMEQAVELSDEELKGAAGGIIMSMGLRFFGDKLRKKDRKEGNYVRFLGGPSAWMG